MMCRHLRLAALRVRVLHFAPPVQSHSPVDLWGQRCYQAEPY